MTTRQETDGQPARGRIVHLSQRDIGVQIEAPYEGIRMDMHIPWFSCQGRKPGDFFEDQGRLTSHGRQTAKYLLLSLLRMCVLFDRRRRSLRRTFDRIAERHTPVPGAIDDGQFGSLRKELRRRMKSGGITPVAYQRELGALRERNRAWNGRLLGIEFEFCKLVDARHGVIVPLGMRRKLMEMFPVEERQHD